ncbi:hypothetical protein EOD42_05525 [Rhodovarius crocodyli]|uniref:Lipoprotein n=1 Tax=Rhodovarius crocodyli TaxID=1979269 RepID=A0A437MPK3_9PROT|nr:hypothetical protein [Rhodovarius crocodyli]RVT99545.1 hypothetical protein EOD42_05525 [Rhodovarius crocodyli]
MRKIMLLLVSTAGLAGCAVYPDGTYGPAPVAVAPAPVVVAPRPYYYGGYGYAYPRYYGGGGYYGRGWRRW